MCANLVCVYILNNPVLLTIILIIMLKVIVHIHIIFSIIIKLMSNMFHVIPLE